MIYMEEINYDLRKEIIDGQIIGGLTKHDYGVNIHTFFFKESFDNYEIISNKNEVNYVIQIAETTTAYFISIFERIHRDLNSEFIYFKSTYDNAIDIYNDYKNIMPQCIKDFLLNQK